MRPYAKPSLSLGGAVARTLSHPRHKLIANYLRERRRAAGLTQVELASQLERPQSFVADVERGQRRVDVVELLNFADVLGFDPGEFIGQLRAK